MSIRGGQFGEFFRRDITQVPAAVLPIAAEKKIPRTNLFALSIGPLSVRLWGKLRDWSGEVSESKHRTIVHRSEP